MLFIVFAYIMPPYDAVAVGSVGRVDALTFLCPEHVELVEDPTLVREE